MLLLTISLTDAFMKKTNAVLIKSKQGLHG